ncbi:MAG: MBL fold metallo-hydrolase [Clostridia bacterium]|nr:MBL fold metallo-hydrolase [Clostridia bacterium]
MVKCVVLRKGPYDVNGYFYIDEKSGRGFLLDPGFEGKRLYEMIKENGWVIEKILITHGHFDHISGIKELKDRIGVPVFIHENGERFLSDPYFNLSGSSGTGKISMTADGYFREGDVIKTEDGALRLKVIHTPGHTLDSCVFLSETEPLAFTGDTIFKGTYGNYLFPTGDHALLIKTIREKVLTLPDDTVLYSGHTEETTVRAEKAMYGIR